MKSYLETSRQRSNSGSIEFNFDGNEKNWFCKDANVNMGEDHVPSMLDMFKNHHADMFSLMDTNSRGNSIDLRPDVVHDSRNAYATGGNVATTPTTPSWTQGAQAMASGGESGEMMVNWGNGQVGKVVR